MKKYLKLYLKKNLDCFFLLTLIFMVTYVIPLTTQNYARWNNPTGSSDEFIYAPELHFAGLFVVLCILCVIIPLVAFSYKMSKRSVDLHYSLPLSKQKIALVRFLVGLILVFGSYTLAYIVGFIVVAVNIERLHLIYYLALYFASLLPAFTIYASTSFLFTRANTLFDGLVCLCGAFCILPLFITSLKTNLAAYLPEGIVPYAFFPFEGIDFLATEFDYAIKNGAMRELFGPDVTVYLQNKGICILTGGAIWTALGIAMTAALFASEKNSRAENCGQISQSVFCYKIQLPVYAFLAASVIDPSNIVSLCTFFLSVAVACGVYKRSFKINLEFLILLLFCLFMGFLFGGIPYWIK